MKLSCGHYRIDLATPAVMGVLNVTPDSFSDGGRYLDPGAAVAFARQLAAEGAAFIDVGGESTRPGAVAVSVAEELRRVLPVVEALAAELAIPISVDTGKPEVARAAIRAGASLINDIRALTTPGMLAEVANSDAAVCVMHMRGEPHSMQDDPRYGDVVSEVQQFLEQRVEACIAAGIAADRIAIDPGFGFGKLLAHNLALLNGLERLRSIGRPVLVGLSRKSMIGTLTGRKLDERQAGSVALATLAASRGANIVRAHEVASTVDAVRIGAAVRAAAAGVNTK